MITEERDAELDAAEVSVREKISVEVNQDATTTIRIGTEQQTLTLDELSALSYILMQIDLHLDYLR